MVSTSNCCEDFMKENRDREHQCNDSNAASSAAIFDRELYRRINILEIDAEFREPSKLLLCKAIADCEHEENATRVLIEDSEGETCSLVVNGLYDIQEGYFIGILNPNLSRDKNQNTVECTEFSIFMFESLQDFKAAGWVEKCITKEGTEDIVALGKKLLNNKNYQEALVQFQLALNSEPSSYQILSYISTCHFHLSNFNEAYTHAKLGYEHNNQHRRSGILCVRSLLCMSKYTEAYSILEEVSKQHPDNLELQSLKKKLDSKVQNIRPYARKLQKVNKTRLNRLKELVLIEWPRLVSSEKIKQKLESEGVPVERLTIRGKTAILFYTNVETREFAREKLLSMPDSDFMLANEPAPFI